MMFFFKKQNKKKQIYHFTYTFFALQGSLFDLDDDLVIILSFLCKLDKGLKVRNPHVLKSIYISHLKFQSYKLFSSILGYW